MASENIDLAKSMNHGEQIDSILIDFSKAFDKVCHRKLLLKLEHHGTSRGNLQWIKKFLENRTQKVAVAGARHQCQLLRQVFYKAQYSDHCCFSFILTTCHLQFHQQWVCLLMMHISADQH